ncbi:hypothetical protein TSAR_006309 [Trichomalopsis sarcophagae]|uniref:Uncharacterized protein n=1 Tax=Trichomalopsis sarcophagae TaxID=543379 RepID=A0A232FKG8_9HYME|nr:hypothetical protein TSAR_006309 [Trichomalopsis sarcophagae]
MGSTTEDFGITTTPLYYLASHCTFFTRSTIRFESNWSLFENQLARVN